MWIISDSRYYFRLNKSSWVFIKQHCLKHSACLQFPTNVGKALEESSSKSYGLLLFCFCFSDSQTFEIIFLAENGYDDDNDDDIDEKKK